MLTYVVTWKASGDCVGGFLPDTRAGTSSSLRFFSVLVPCAGEAPAPLPADGTQGVAGPHSIPPLCASEVGI